MPQLPPIVRFQGAHYFLSNFYPHPVRMYGIEYKSAEHAFQSFKMTNEGDRQKVMNAINPSHAKRIARSLPCMSDWDEVRVGVMKNVLRAKFRLWNSDQTTRNPLSIRLIQTGNAELIEGNWWGDTFWGQCPVGNGENMLGKLLMKVRSEISHGG